MSERSGPGKDADAYRTIGEVAEDLHVPQHVLRFWETRFPEIRPLKRAGGRRFYRPEDVALLRAVQTLLYAEGYTIKGVQRLLGEFGARHVAEALVRSTLAGPPAAGDGEGPAEGRAARKEISAAPSAAGTPVAAAPLPPAADIVARLEGALADLSECRRLISSIKPIES